MQVIAGALDVAKHRRQKLLAELGPATPDCGDRAGVKRKELKKGDPSSASTTASSTKAVATEKVTPDPKCLRTSHENGPSPKTLFASPMDVEEGGTWLG